MLAAGGCAGMGKEKPQERERERERAVEWRENRLRGPFSLISPDGRADGRTQTDADDASLATPHAAAATGGVRVSDEAQVAEVGGGRGGLRRCDVRARERVLTSVLILKSPL